MIQEAREIIITIRGDGTGSSAPSTSHKTLAGQTAYAGKEKEKPTASVIASVYANQAFNYAKSAVISQARFQVNRYFAMTDDYQGKQDVDNALHLIGIGMTIYGATKAGAIVGAKFGAVGAIIGAVIGFIGSTGNEILSAHRAVATQELQIRQSTAQLSYTMSRRGASLQNNSIGENL